MASDHFTHEVTVDLQKADAWEVEWLHSAAKTLRGYVIKGRYMIFIYEDHRALDAYGDTPPIKPEEYTESLDDVLYNLMAKGGLSLTYLSHWNPGDDGWREEPTDYVELAEQIPTLILQEVLAKRLEKSV